MEQDPVGPGWYPDPDARRPQLKYWNGTTWTNATRAYDEPIHESDDNSGSDSSKPPTKRSRSFGLKWGALGIFTIGAVVIAIALISGQQISEVNLSTGTFRFEPTAEEEAEIQQSQPQAEAEVAQLEEQAQALADSSDPAGVDLSGTWWSSPPDGLRWEMSQAGENVVIQGLSPDGFIVYTGSGVVDPTGEGSVILEFSSVYDGSYFSGELELSGPNTLTGFLTDSFGNTGQVQLDR